MTEQKRQKAIHHYEQAELPFGKVNDNMEFYLVEQGREEEDLKKFFK